jgi:hypothetical protein
LPYSAGTLRALRHGGENIAKKMNHRRDAEDAEAAQSCFSDRLLKANLRTLLTNHLVLEMAHSGENHRQIMFIGSGDNFIVAH